MNQREQIARARFGAQERIRQIIKLADLPAEAFWERKDCLAFMAYMREHILSGPHAVRPSDLTVYAIATEYLEEHFPAPETKVVPWLLNWKVVRWVLRLCGANACDPRSLVL